MFKELIFDKFSYSGDYTKRNHDFLNQHTLKINEETKYDKCIENLQEIHTFLKNNDLVNLGLFIPDSLDEKLYKIRLCFKKETEVELIWLSLFVDTDEIKNYTDVNNVPQSLFFINSCTYSYFYQDSINDPRVYEYKYNDIINEALIKKNINEITQNALKSVSYTNDKAVEQPKILTTPLFDYQRCSIYWMRYKENNKELINYDNFKYMIDFDNYYYNIDTNKFNTSKKDSLIKFFGGGLIDEVGLGKTLQITAVSLLNKFSSKKKFIDKKKKEIYSKATLILCPNTLTGQWGREIKKMVKVKKYDIKIISILTKRHFDKYTLDELINADFVIMSFNFIKNKIYTGTIGKEHKDFFAQTKLNYVNSYDVYKDQKKVIYNSIKWHRVVIDEFHEIYSTSETDKVDKNAIVKQYVEHFNGNNKWVVSATPFINDSIMIDIFNFLTDYKVDKEAKKLLENKKIVNYLKTNVFRRNTKESIEKEFKLPTIKEEIHWLNFTLTERSMYDAFLANGTNDIYSEYLRKLCCHPKLSDETKHVLSACNTLEDIEKAMTLHYKQDVEAQQKRVDDYKNKIYTCIKQYRKTKQEQFIKRIETYLKNNKQDETLIKYVPDNVVKFDFSFIDNNKYKFETEYKKVNTSNAKKEDLYNLDLIIDIIQNDIDEKKKKSADYEVDSQLYLNYKETIQGHDFEYNHRVNILNGKKNTLKYYTDVIERVKKTATKEKKHSVEKKFDPSNAMAFLDDSDSDDEESEEQQDEETCGVCLLEITKENIGITKCGHIFHHNCITKALINKKSCPYCNKHTKEKDVMRYKPKVVKKEINIPEHLREIVNNEGTKVAYLIDYLKKSSSHCILFSQWDDLLEQVGKSLNKYNIKTVYCKGNVYQRDNVIKQFNENDDIKVIMLSSKKAASGTNLTKATKIILIDPVYGDYSYRRDTENQAIGRAHRIGQKERISVVRFVIKDSVEEDIYNKNKIEDEKKNYDIERKEFEH